MSHSPVELSRRRVLQGTGGFFLALPWLETFSRGAQAQTVTRPKRMVVFATSQGMPMTLWSPPAGGALQTLPPFLQALDPFKSKMVMVEGLDHHSGYINENLGGHAAAYSLFTCEAAHGNLDAAGNLLPPNQQTAPMVSNSGGPSIEQVVSRRIRTNQPYASIDLAIGTQGQPGGRDTYLTPLPTEIYGARFFSARNQPVLGETNPFAAFARLFSSLPGSQADAAAERLRLQRISVLDAVRENFTAFNRRLGTADRQRLDAHATKVRDLEQRLTAAAPPPAMCSQPWSQVPLSQQNQFWIDEGAAAPLQHRMLAMAMACNLAPVGTLMHDRAHSPEFRWLRSGSSLIPSGFTDWHDMVHLGRNRQPAPTHTYQPELVEGFGWYVRSFAGLLQELASIPEDGATVLDNTLVLWASEFGEGFGHELLKIPVILAGNLGGSPTGRVIRAPTTGGATSNYYTQHFYSASQQSTNNLYVSVLRAFGQTDNQFGRVGTFRGHTTVAGPLVGFHG